MRSGGFIAPPPPAEAVLFGEATLWAGDLFAEAEPVRVSTVLGSCVSVCLYDPSRRFGGMNHYLVPRGGRRLIHGDLATATLIERMEKLGADVGALQAKVFGGGSPLKLENEALAIGAENVAVAREVLGAFGIPIVAEKVGHGAGVRLFFENWTGVVWLRAHEAGKMPAVRSPRRACAAGVDSGVSSEVCP
jgi:chemotaxis protein CheD